MIISILLTYCIVMCWWCYSWLRINTRYIIYNNNKLFINVFVVFIFIFIFIFFLRLLNLFRERKTINLNSFNISLDNIMLIILVLLLLYSLRRLLVYFFKTRWFRLHYFLLSPFNLPRVYKWYGTLYINIIYNPAIFLYKYLNIINIILSLGLVLIFIVDLTLNNYVLDISLLYLRYYSIFKLVYLLSRFIFEKQNSMLDYYNYNYLYPGIVDENPFHTIMDSKHRSLIEEAINYRYGIIMESQDYTPKKIDYTDNAYYRYLNPEIKYVKIYPSFDAFVDSIIEKKKKDN